MSIAVAYGIKPHNPKKALLKKNGKTKDIVKVVLDVERTDRDDTVEFAKNFKPTTAGMAKLYRWVKNNIIYKEDPPGVQWIQTPSYLAFTKVGDCKSFTVFLCSVFYNMGLDYFIEFAAYPNRQNSKRLTHVYPIVILPTGQQIPMDVVYSVIEGGPAVLPDHQDKFGQEKPYLHKKTFFKSSKMADIFKLGNMPQASQLEMQMAHAVSDIDDSIIEAGPGDVTQMTSGEFDRLIMAERMSLLAQKSTSPSTAAEYRAAEQALLQGGISGIGSMSTGVGRDVEKFLQKASRNRGLAFKMPSHLERLSKQRVSGIGKALKKLFQKFINWLVKGPMTAMSPHFLFIFIQKPTNAKINARRNKQLKTLRFISKKTGISTSKLNAMIYNGILKKTGMTPQEILNSRGPKISAVQFIAILGKVWTFIKAAIKFVIKVVKKIIGLFGKKGGDAGEIGEGSTSDINLLEELPDGSPPKGGDGGTGPSKGGGGHSPGTGPGGGTSSGSGSGAGSSGGMSSTLPIVAAALFAMTLS